MNKKVLIFEPFPGGHRGEYARILCNALNELNVEVLMAMPTESLASDWSRTHSINQSTAFTHIAFDEPQTNSLLALAKSRLGIVSAIAHRHKPNYVYIPFADGIAQAWGTTWNPRRVFPSGTLTEGLLMRNTSAYPPLTKRNALTLAKRHINNYALRRAPWTKLHTLDPITFAASISANTRRPNWNLQLLPETIESPTPKGKPHAHQALNINPDGRLFLTCPGELNARKGSIQLLEAYRHSGLKNHVRLLLLGSHTPEVERAIKEQYSDLVDNGHIHSRNKILTSDEFEAVLDIADIIALPYQQHRGSSSILLKAAARGKRLITSKTGFLGWATTTLSLGFTFDETSIEDIANALKQAAETPFEEQRNPTAALTELLRFHSKENHIAHWTKGIRDFYSLGKGSEQLVEFPPSLLNSLNPYVYL